VEGTGTIDDPFRITNVTELQAMNNNLSAYYVLANDIDASETASWNGGKGFRPIGLGIDTFKGYFDGCDYTISGLTINDTSANPCGLFSNVSGNVNTYIKNVKLSNVYIRGGFYTGGLVGQAFGISAITDCHLSGTVIGDTWVGGLIGYTYITIPNIVNCSVNASISSSTTDSIVGGLIGAIVVGSSNRTMYIQKCKTNVNINSTSSRVGGLIGYIYQLNQYRINNKIYIQQCCSNGSLVNHTANTASRTGGFIGHTYQCEYTTNNYAYISDCYSRCSVDCDMQCRGSFIGSSSGGTDIRRCYATGFVTSRDSNYTKGFVGTQYRSTFADNYFDMETTGQTSGLGATGRTTAQMKTQSNYTNWDFQAIWRIRENRDYPSLQAFPIEVITDIGEIIRLKSAIGRTISLKSSIGRTISLKSSIGRTISLKSSIGRTISLKSSIGRTISLKSSTGTEEYKK